MTFTKEFCKKNILLDTDAYIDTLEYDGFTNYVLSSTKDLDKIMDKWRVENGFVPLFDETRDDCDLEGWYEFRCNVYKNGKVELYAWADYGEEASEEYDFDLSDEEQKNIKEELEKGWGCIDK